MIFQDQEKKTHVTLSPPLIFVHLRKKTEKAHVASAEKKKFVTWYTEM